jgi:hypothetical protein
MPEGRNARSCCATLPARRGCISFTPCPRSRSLCRRKISLSSAPTRMRWGPPRKNSSHGRPAACGNTFNDRCSPRCLPPAVLFLPGPPPRIPTASTSIKSTRDRNGGHHHAECRRLRRFTRACHLPDGFPQPAPSQGLKADLVVTHHGGYKSTDSRGKRQVVSGKIDVLIFVSPPCSPRTSWFKNVF